MEYLLRVSDPVSRLKSLGLPKPIAYAFWQEVSKWVDNSGPAWTVSRLKSLKNDLVRRKASLPPLTWVRKNRNGGWFGVVGALFRLSDRSEKWYNRVIQAFMLYSAFIPVKPTDDHIRKFTCGVQAPDDFIPRNLLDEIASVAIEQCGIQEHADPESLVTFQGCPSTRSPIFGEKSVPQDKHLEKELLWITEGKPFAHVAGGHSIFLNRHYSCYGPVLEGLDMFLAQNSAGLPGLSGSLMSRDFGPFQTIYSKQKVSLPYPPWGGKVIPLTKDGGWKVRWIASPCRIHQLALKPLGLSLYKLLTTLPWDCTYHQEKGIPTIQKHLRSGKTAYAVDLSSATDYFPLKLQLAVLRALYPESPYVELFADLSRAEWSSPLGRITWTKGQPMGLYPSFASFGLTHGLLLAMLAGVYRNQFFVLGDDVVILDAQLYERYLSTLDLLGCPHDPHKSIVSSQVTEFAGKIITEDNVVPQFKWHEVSDNNFLDLVRNNGQGFAKNLSRQQREVYKRIAPLLLPVGCEHSQGSESMGLAEKWLRTEIFKDEAKVVKKGRKFYTSFLRQLHDTLQPSCGLDSLYHRLDVSKMVCQAQTHDLRVLKEFSRLPRQVPAFADVTDLFEFTGITPDLTPMGPTNVAGQRTLLSFYQEALGISDD